MEFPDKYNDMRKKNEGIGVVFIILSRLYTFKSLSHEKIVEFKATNVLINE